MGLFSRIYFNAVFGALGGLVGWMLFGVFGLKSLDGRLGFLPFIDLQNLLGGALIGGAVGYLVVSAEALRDRALLRAMRLACYGLLLGACGGAAGLEVGDWLNYLLVQKVGADQQGAAMVLGVMFARGLGWMFLGMAIGVSEGVAARSLGRFSYSTLGGAIGGFLGGALFGLAYHLTKDKGGAVAVWTALGLVILGACIGSLSALVQGVFQPASLKVLRGWQEGREYPLDKTDNVLGRDEHADIALFRDMRVEKRHAVIQRDGERFVFLNNDAPPEQTRVNDEPVPQLRDLRDGDRIQLGHVVLRFQLRAAKARGG
jgi:type III secretion system (T3SS) inner membrane Yop/YscD-like protein